jgi:riboflavin kinase/FMN adenylyltransferase
VFHTRVDISGRSYPSVTNIGSHPTFPAPAAAGKVEAHIPGFRRTVYGKKVRLHFIDKIRDEKKFANAGELAEQIRRDIASLAI